MTEAKPWEPVSYCWDEMPEFPQEWNERAWRWMDRAGDVLSDGIYIVANLANSQRVIVRALSEDRKAARRKRQEWKGVPL